MKTVETETKPLALITSTEFAQQIGVAENEYTAKNIFKFLGIPTLSLSNRLIFNLQKWKENTGKYSRKF